MAIKKNTWKTIIILSLIPVVIVLGVIFDLITFDPPKEKNNSMAKASDECFKKLKKRLTQKELRTITIKKKWNESYCVYL